MKLTVKQMIKINNEKRKLLTPENETYYGNLLVYTRMKPFKEEKATEEMLLDLLEQLLSAQQEGKSAEEMFGSSPKELADRLIQKLPKASKKSTIEFVLEMTFTLFGWFLIIWGIWPTVKQEDVTIRLGSLTVSAVLLIGSLFLLVYLFTNVLRNYAFSNQKKQKVISIVLGIGIVVLYTAVFLLNFVITPFGPELTVSYYTPFGLGCFFLLASYILKKYRVTT